MDIKQILKELEKQKDKIAYLKKLLKKIKDKKLIKQIQELIKYLEKRENLEERIAEEPTQIQPRQIMQSLQQEALEIPEYKSTTLLPEEQVITIPRTPEELNGDNPYKTAPSELYLTQDIRNPIKAEKERSYEVDHLESTITTEAKQQITAKLKPTMSEQEMIKDVSEFEETREYTTGVAQLEEEFAFNPFHTSKKNKKRPDYQKAA